MAKSDTDGWTIDTLKIYVDQLAQAQKDATAAALAAAKEASDKASEASNKRFESVNEFRAAMSDREKNFADRQVTENRLSHIEEAVAELRGTNNGRSYLGLINSGGIVLLIAIITGFWSLANPRDDIKSIKESYLSIREHNEFRERVQHDLDRVESQNLEQNRGFVTHNEFESYKTASNKYHDELARQVDKMVTKDTLAMHEERDNLLNDATMRRIDALYSLIRDIQAMDRERSRPPTK